VKSAPEGEWVVKGSPPWTSSTGWAPADLVLFCVKSFDTESAGRALAPVLGPDTGVLSIQNGVDNEEKLEAIVGKGRVLGWHRPGLRHHRIPWGDPAHAARTDTVRGDGRA
jgi:ketopantoate reductase